MKETYRLPLLFVGYVLLLCLVSMVHAVPFFVVTGRWASLPEGTGGFVAIYLFMYCPAIHSMMCEFAVRWARRDPFKEGEQSERQFFKVFRVLAAAALFLGVMTAFRTSMFRIDLGWDWRDWASAWFGALFSSALFIPWLDLKFNIPHPAP